MAEKKEAEGGKKKKVKAQNVKIYARVRCLMPWEPKKVSLSSKGNIIRNQTDKSTNEYTFQKVFGTNVVNIQIFKVMVQPMIDNVLQGFNAVLIAYGQTGSGKTFTMLGKPKLKVVGLLPYMLKEVIETPSVYKLELGAVEAFGHHVARIELFDLYESKNQVPAWPDKIGNTGLVMSKAKRVPIRNIDEAYSQIRYAHAASHFAMTGKNPESSRGHVTFVAKIFQNDPDGSASDLISYFLMLDCAGSEGESAFTPEFKASVDKQTLMQRRLEAGCINTGLCALQIIFNELRTKQKLSKMQGNGLRRVLHPFINTSTVISVIFTFSPSANNAKATESTLKFAVTAGMVKVKPVKAELKMNLDKLVLTLRKHIEANEKIIDEQEDEILKLEGESSTLQQQAVMDGYMAADVVKGNAAAAYGDEDDWDDDGLEEYMDDDGQIQVRKRKRVKRDKFTNALSKKLKNKLALLDDLSDTDDELEADDDMLVVSKDVSSKGIEKDLKSALKTSKKNENNAKLLKKNLGIDIKDAEDDEKVAETLNNNDIDEQANKFEEEELNKLFKKDAPPEYTKMNKKELVGNVKNSWKEIQSLKKEQEKLKQQQQNVVDHLVDTNAWLFNALNEILEDKV